MNKIIVSIVVVISLLIPSVLGAVDEAPRITDREIVEGLARLEEGQKSLEQRIDGLDKSLNKRSDDLRSETNGRFDDLRSEMNSRFDSLDKRIDTLQWMFGLFTTVSIIILGFVVRMQWQMQRRQAIMETTLEAQKDELAFIKGLIEKLLTPKGAL